jgi:hypothetical protein
MPKSRNQVRNPRTIAEIVDSEAWAKTVFL